ncbi:MAG: TRAP transporter small permease subunit [Maricaulaceae bacterium]
MYETAQSVGAALGWIGWALSPLSALPLALVLAAALGAPLGAGLATTVSRLAHAVDQVTAFAGRVGQIAGVALVLVIVVVVAQRYVFGISLTKLQESILYLHALVFMLGAAATLSADAHVRVDVIYAGLSARTKAWINLAGAYGFIVPLGVVILRVSRAYVDLAWRVGEGSAEADGLPLVFALKTLIPVFAVLMIAQAGIMAARASLTLAGRPSDPPPAPAAPV